MKKILGLDLGIGSIGWALIGIEEEKPEESKIEGLGSRVILLKENETTGFTQGNGETINSQRTVKRCMRRNMDRYQQRRKMLAQLLEEYGMNFSEGLLKLSPLELWKLRSDAAKGERLSLPEIGRVLYHLNQRRGYRNSKDENQENKNSAYLSAIDEREREALSHDETPGQYFYRKLNESRYQTERGHSACSYRVKEQVFPRRMYEAELKQILTSQAVYYPEILSEENQIRIFNTIMYQRPLRSCKHLVSICEFESKEILNSKGKKIQIGPRVAPKSSPLAQLCRIWETVNNIELKNYKNKSKKKQTAIPLFGDGRLSEFIYTLNNSERTAVVEFLSKNEKMSSKELFRILGMKKDDGFTVDKNINKGIKGNSTYCALRTALNDEADAEKYLRFDISFEDSSLADTETGEIHKKVSSLYLKEPLYMLWHTVYSINDKEELSKALKSKFGIENPVTLEKLFHLDFRGEGYSNKSSKFICEILPYLTEGLKYSEACEMVGVNHSSSLTKEENEKRELTTCLEPLPKNSLRQPVVEKILNQMIHQVNAIVKENGPIDEIRIEMARQLKQSKEERNREFSRNNARERENKKISEIISGYGFKPSKNRIQKYRMWKESEECCMYCGKPIGVHEFLSGMDVEKEHVIPRSIFFDDSFSNKVCACRDCNHRKGQMTGFDFMQNEGEKKFKEYTDRVERLYAQYKTSKGTAGISRTKHDRLMTSKSEIPQDFIERDLRQSQYIAKKAMEILKGICRNVYASSGSVTDFFRHAWGYDKILHELNLPYYSKAGQTETITVSHKGSSWEEERIKEWSKRLDHRHHAIDALTIALTRQGYIQRLNTLSSISPDNESKIEGEYMRQGQNLDKWASEQFHFPYHTVKKAVSEIAVSFKSEGKVTVPGKRYIYKRGKAIPVQRGLMIPRGPLTEDSVYGIIKRVNSKTGIGEFFKQPQNICSPKIREAIENRLSEFKGNITKAKNSLKKRPLAISGKDTNPATAAVFESIVVIRYKIEAIKYSKVDQIVDIPVREAIKRRFEELNHSDEAFAKSLSERPIFRDNDCRFPIKRVRCATNNKLESMTAIKKDADGNPIGYSLNGNNHHVALYETPEGTVEISVIPFTHAVRRKQLGIPVIIKDPQQVWEIVSDRDDIEEDILSRIPMPDCKFLLSMQINDMFVIGLTDEELSDCKMNRDFATLTSHLYRVQSISLRDYVLIKHTSALTRSRNEQSANGNYIRITSLETLKKLNNKKVKINRLGKIEFL